MIHRKQTILIILIALIPGILTSYIFLTASSLKEDTAEIVEVDKVVGDQILRDVSEFKHILKFDKDGNFVKDWGIKGYEDGQFLHVHGIAVDSFGNVYTADFETYSIQKFDSEGNFLLKWGSEGKGDGQFTKIEDINVDSSNFVYVVDYGYQRIQKFDQFGNFITKWGSRGSDDGEFNRPWGIDFDRDGNFFVTDRNNNRVQKFDSEGNFLLEWGSEDQFPHLHGVVVDTKGNVFVNGEVDTAVHVFDNQGNYISKWGSEGTGDGQFISPHGMAFDSKGHLYLVDTVNARIQKFSPWGELIEKWGTRGLVEGQFIFPHDIAIDSSDNIYVSDQGVAHSELHLIGKFLESVGSEEKIVKTPILKSDDLQSEVIYAGEEFYSGFAFIGPDDILVLDTFGGNLSRITNGTLWEEPLLTVPVVADNERGLLGIDVAKNVKPGVDSIFLYYTEADNAGNAIGNRLYSYELKDDKIMNPKLLLDLPVGPGIDHNGGVVSVGPDNNVYVIVGDINQDNLPLGFTPTRNSADGLIDGRSGILRVTQEGKVVGDGILGKDGPLNMYYAYGIRNGFGIDFDPVTNKLWDTENGSTYGDEINLVEPGFNSGWDKVMGMSFNQNEFRPNTLVNFDGKGKYSEPELEWKSAVAPTALLFISTNIYGKEYENDLLVGAVNYGGRIYHFNLNYDRTELLLEGPVGDKIADSVNELEEYEFAINAGTVTDLKIGPDGYLYILTNYDSEGVIVKIIPK